MMNGVISFNTSLGTHVIIRSVDVKPKSAALIKLIYMDSFEVVEKHNIIMEGADYLAWGNDDDYLAHFVINKLTGGAAKLVREDGTSAEYQPPTIVTSVGTDDTRSVHNEEDIQRIQTLQEQLDEQKKKLETIMGLLLKNGAL